MIDNGGAFTSRLLAEAGIRPGMDVLDVGCGNGEVSLKLAAMVGPDGRVTGLDRDEAALDRARERLRAEGHANAAFIAGDLAAPALPPGRYDAVVGRRVLMYLADPEQSLRALARVMRPGGVIVFQEHDSARLEQVPLPPLHARIHDLLWRTIVAEGGSPHIGLALAPTLRRAGFAIAGATAEATMLVPEIDNLVGQIAAIMIPRMTRAGVIAAGELDPASIGGQLDDERRASTATFCWETVFGVWARLDAA